MYMNTYACIYMCICMCMNICASIVSLTSDALAYGALSSMRMRVYVHMYAYAYVCMYTYLCILFAVSVACTLEQVFWALVHVQTYTLYRYLLDFKVHICDTLAAGCAHMCMCIYICMRMHMYMDTYVRLWYCLRRWGVVAEIFCLCIGVHIHAYVCVCACMRVCVHVHMFVHACMCVCVYVYIYMYIHTRVGVHMQSCRRILLLSNLSTTCVCITGVWWTPACVCRRGLEVGVFHGWRLLLAWKAMFWQG